MDNINIGNELRECRQRLAELEVTNGTIRQLATILQTQYIEVVPITQEQKESFCKSYCSIDELIRVISDYTDKVQDGILSISNDFQQIITKIKEGAKE